jgi:hypothetical protein
MQRAKRQRTARVEFLGEDEAERAAAAAAERAGGGAAGGEEADEPARTVQISKTQASAIKEWLVGRELPRDGTDWTDEQLEELSADVMAKVPRRTAPDVQLLRRWLANHGSKPGAKARVNVKQRELLDSAVEKRTHSANDLDAALQPLLAQLNAAGAKKLTATDVRQRLRKLEKKAAAARAAEVAAAAQQAVDDTQPLMPQVEALVETVIGAFPPRRASARALSAALRPQTTRRSSVR